MVPSRKYILLGLTFSFVLVGGIAWRQSSNVIRKVPEIHGQIYRNTEFGFEFQYPAGWQLFPNIFTNASSKFNLTGAAPAEDEHPNPINPSISINLVAPEFAKDAIGYIESSTTEKADVLIDGIKGIKYTYIYRGEHLLGVILPAKPETTFIFEAMSSYDSALNMITGSFKLIP